MTELGLDRKDLEMMSVSIPVVDWWDIREEIEKLNDNVNRLERVVEVLIELYRTERVKKLGNDPSSDVRETGNPQGKWE